MTMLKLQDLIGGRYLSLHFAGCRSVYFRGESEPFGVPEIKGLGQQTVQSEEY